MQGTQYNWVQTARYYASLSLVYTLTVAFGWFAFNPVERPQAPLASANTIEQIPVLPTIANPDAISGKPVRLVIPDSGIDLPIDDGYYDTASGSWTISGERAQFAVTSSLANNQAGDTFIYGHNNNAVFGPLRHNKPQAGAKALLYTDNGHVFAYSFRSSVSVTPDDTSPLDYTGAPVLTVLTCTGLFDEWRTLFRFSFQEVVQ